MLVFAQAVSVPLLRELAVSEGHPRRPIRECAEPLPSIWGTQPASDSFSLPYFLPNPTCTYLFFNLILIRTVHPIDVFGERRQISEGGLLEPPRSRRQRQQPREDAGLMAAGGRVGKGTEVRGELVRVDPSTLRHGGHTPYLLNASGYLTPKGPETA